VTRKPGRQSLLHVIVRTSASAPMRADVAPPAIGGRTTKRAVAEISDVVVASVRDDDSARIFIGVVSPQC